VDEKTAQAIQLRLEYNPAPPFNSGSPDTAPADLLNEIKERIAPLKALRAEKVAQAAAKLDARA
jgi:cyclohexyl-isocyanide hydratase